MNSKKRSKSYGNAQLVPLLDSLRQRRYTSYDQRRKPSDPSTSMNLLPIKNKDRGRFGVLATLGRDQEDPSSDDNAIDDEIDEESTSNVLESEQHKGYQDNEDMEQDENEDDARSNEDPGEHLSFEDDAFESSDEEYFLPQSQRYGYPYANKVPVIDIVVSDEEIEENLDS